MTSHPGVLLGSASLTARSVLFPKVIKPPLGGWDEPMRGWNAIDRTPPPLVEGLPFGYEIEWDRFWLVSFPRGLGDVLLDDLRRMLAHA